MRELLSSELYQKFNSLCKNWLAALICRWAPCPRSTAIRPGLLSQGLNGHAVCLQEMPSLAHVQEPAGYMWVGAPSGGVQQTWYLTSPAVRTQAAWQPWNGRGIMYEMTTTLVDSLPAGQPKGQPWQLAAAPRVRHTQTYCHVIEAGRGPRWVCVYAPLWDASLMRHASLSPRPSRLQRRQRTSGAARAAAAEWAQGCLQVAQMSSV